MLSLTLTRILMTLTLAVSLRGSTPDAPHTPAAPAATATAARARAARFVDDTEGCREQPVAAPVAPTACE